VSNKSIHLIQNPLLLVTLTRNMWQYKDVWIKMSVMKDIFCAFILHSPVWFLGSSGEPMFHNLSLLNKNAYIQVFSMQLSNWNFFWCGINILGNKWETALEMGNISRATAIIISSSCNKAVTGVMVIYLHSLLLSQISWSENLMGHSDLRLTSIDFLSYLNSLL
jgi:hypothetical protein